MTSNNNPTHCFADESMHKVIAIDVAKHSDDLLHKLNNDASEHELPASGVYDFSENTDKADTAQQFEASTIEKCMMAFNNTHDMTNDQLVKVVSEITEHCAQLNTVISASVTELTEKYNAFQLGGMEKINALFDRFQIQQKLDLVQEVFEQILTDAQDSSKKQLRAIQCNYNNLSWKVKASIYSAVGIVVTIAGVLLYRYLYKIAAKLFRWKSDISAHEQPSDAGDSEAADQCGSM